MREDDFTQVTDLTKFQKKCIIIDYNGTLKNNYSAKADYFLLDLCVLSYNLVKAEYPDGTVHFFTGTGWFNRAYKNGLETFFVEDGANLQHIDRIDYLTDEIIKEVLKNEIEYIKSLGYREDQIILIEVKRSYSYMEDNHLHFFAEGDRKLMNERLDYAYTTFKKIVPGCHVIPTPVTAYCDSEHKWGLYDLHYCNEYYQYLLQAVNSIVSRRSPDGHDYNNGFVLDLCHKYDCFLYNKVNHLIKNSIKLINGINYLKDFGEINNYVATIGGGECIFECNENRYAACIY